MTLMLDRLWESKIKKDKRQCPSLVGVDGSELDVFAKEKKKFK